MKILFITSLLFFTHLPLLAQTATDAARIANQVLASRHTMGSAPDAPCEACIGFSKNIPINTRLNASEVTDLNQFRFYSDPNSSVCDDHTGRTGTYIKRDGTHLFSHTEATTRRDQAVGPGPMSSVYGEIKPDNNDIIRKYIDPSTLQTDLRIFIPINSYTCEPYPPAKCAQSSYSDDRNDANVINFPDAPCGGAITYNYANGENLVIHTYPAALQFKQECDRAQLHITGGKGGICLSFKSDSDTNTRNNRSVTPPVELDFCLDTGHLGNETGCVGDPVASPEPEPVPTNIDCCKNGAAGSDSLCTTKDVPGYEDKETFHVVECTGTGGWGKTLAILECSTRPECCNVDLYPQNASSCRQYVLENGRRPN